MNINQLSSNKVKPLSDVTGFTPKVTYPMQLMFGQPNNAKNTKFHLEASSTSMTIWSDILKERVNTLSTVASETLDNVKTFFRISPDVSYGIAQIPYTVVAKVELPNVIGLKCSIKDYSHILGKSLDVALSVLEFELPAVTRLVATLLTDKTALTSLSPIPALADIKAYSQETTELKNELAAVIGENKNKPFVTFGESYYSNGEYREVSKRIQNMSIKIGKHNLKRYAKDVQNLTALMDRLIMRSNNQIITEDNLSLYSRVIEECSNNIAFAGATIHLCETLIEVSKEHNKVLEAEIDDYKKHNKK